MSLLGRTIRAIGAKRAARALGYSLGHTYRLARDPADPEHPDNTGTDEDPWTRLVALLEVVATYPRHRWILREWQVETDRVFRRLIDRDDPGPATHDHVVEGARLAIKEHGEAMSEALREGDEDRALEETCQAIDAMERLARTLRAKIDHDNGVMSLEAS